MYSVYIAGKVDKVKIFKLCYGWPKVIYLEEYLLQSFQVQGHTARKSSLRPVTKWMREKISIIHVG